MRTEGSPYKALICSCLLCVELVPLFRREALARAVEYVFGGAGIKRLGWAGDSSITALLVGGGSWPDAMLDLRASCAAWNFCAADRPPTPLVEFERGVSILGFEVSDTRLALLA